MSLPDVTLTLGNGNLGRLPATQEGLCGIVFGPCAVNPSNGTVFTPYLIRSLADAEALGITQAYDEANDLICWHHLKEFYEERQGSQPLWIIISAQAQTAHFDANQEADMLMQASDGNIRLVLGCFTPAVAVSAWTQGLPTVLTTVAADAKAFVARQFALHRPVRVLLEGYGIESAATLSYDLRGSGGPQANNVQVIIGQNRTLLGVGYDGITEFASAGRVLGRASRISCHRSIARVKDGPLVGVTSAGFSDNTALSAVSATQLATLNTLGYVFFRAIAGLPGVYINDSHMACPIEDDFATLERGRVMDECARIAYEVYIREINEDVELDSDGRLAVAVVKNLEGIIETAIGTRLAGKISGVTAYIDPDQNIQSTDQVEVEISILARGVVRKFLVNLAYTTSLNN